MDPFSQIAVQFIVVVVVAAAVSFRVARQSVEDSAVRTGKDANEMWARQIAINDSQEKHNRSVQRYMEANTESIKALREIVATQAEVRTGQTCESIQ